MPEQSPSLSIKGIIFKDGDARLEVLLLRNERQEWELPGGKMEGDETPEACLKREFKEETGLEVAVGPCVGSGVLTITPPHVPCATAVWVLAYGCRLTGSSVSGDQNVLISDEHQAWRWVPVAELAGMTDVPDLYKSSILTWSKQ